MRRDCSLRQRKSTLCISLYTYYYYSRTNNHQSSQQHQQQQHFSSNRQPLESHIEEDPHVSSNMKLAANLSKENPHQQSTKDGQRNDGGAWSPSENLAGNGAALSAGRKSSKMQHQNKVVPYYSQNTGVEGIIGKLGRLEAMILA